MRIEDQPGMQPGQRILRLNGALVMTTMFEFQAMVRADDSRSLIIDFSSVPYVDSAGLGEIVRCYTTVSRKGGKLKLINLTKKIQDLLAITKLLTVFEVYDSEEEAIRSFGS